MGGESIEDVVVGLRARLKEDNRPYAIEVVEDREGRVVLLVAFKYAIGVSAYSKDFLKEIDGILSDEKPPQYVFFDFIGFERGLYPADLALLKDVSKDVSSKVAYFRIVNTNCFLRKHFIDSGLEVHLIEEYKEIIS